MPCEDGCSLPQPQSLEGGRLVVAYESDWASVKALAARCDDAEIPVQMGPSPGKG